MSLVVNNNLMAANTARNLNAHYGRLATSTQRLSSGLRINSAADDAAGLAIRELQRADIAALHQGARNANDAISMIQVADGSLGIIDEKLIRMKELAEQAATGTYDSTQRLMIESEYQAMASEITRIANATDFNGTKLLDGTLSGDHDGSGLVSEGKMKIHFGTGNDSAEDYYYIEIGECTSEAFGLGNNSTWADVQNRGLDAFKTSLEKQIKESKLEEGEKGKLYAQLGVKGEDGNYPTDSILGQMQGILDKATNPETAWQYWDEGDESFWVGNSDLMADYLAAAATPASDTLTDDAVNAVLGHVEETTNGNPSTFAEIKASVLAAIADPDAGLTQAQIDALTNAANDVATTGDTGADAKALFTTALNDAKMAYNEAQEADSETTRSANIEKFWKGLRTTQQEKLKYAWGQAAIADMAKGFGTTVNPEEMSKDFQDLFEGIQDALKTLDGSKEGIPMANDVLDRALVDMETKVGHMDFAGHTIETQEDAQHALDAINDAIVSKDKIRAHLGATQNRLENTVSNLNIQAENLQAAESRISDVDVATEMTQFVRNQILTQSAVAMLSQANSLPQMAMQLIGG